MTIVVAGVVARSEYRCLKQPEYNKGPNHPLIRATLHWQRYAAFFSLSCRSFAHRAFCAAAILRRAATDMWR